MSQPAPEPWLRGSLEGVHPLVAPLCHSLEQAREDLAALCAGLTDDDLWTDLGQVAPLGYQLKHLAGSVNRLATYLAGEQLSTAQLEQLSAESDVDDTPPADVLLAGIEQAFRQVEEQARSIDPATLADPRPVGRLALPSSVMGLLVHIAEHTQRHVGEAIVTAKILNSAR